MPPTTVFVVEDANNLRELLGEVLGRYGDAVLTAASVPEAEALRQGMGLGGLDLGMTDLRLTCVPQAREGYELIQRWHAVAPALPFILISGDLRPHDLRELPVEGVRCLAKSFETATLLTAIRVLRMC
jgi:CheY-like chemotaxis protein